MSYKVGGWMNDRREGGRDIWMDEWMQGGRWREKSLTNQVLIMEVERMSEEGGVDV